MWWRCFVCNENIIKGSKQWWAFREQQEKERKKNHCPWIFFFNNTLALGFWVLSDVTSVELCVEITITNWVDPSSMSNMKERIKKEEEDFNSSS